MDRMLRSMTRKQLVEWMAFAELEPFDETRMDIRTAAIQATLVELHRDREKRRRAYTWMDFVIPFGDEPKRETPREMEPRQTEAEMMFIAMMCAAGSQAEEAEVIAAAKRRKRQ